MKARDSSMNPPYRDGRLAVVVQQENVSKAKLRWRPRFLYGVPIVVSDSPVLEAACVLYDLCVLLSAGSLLAWSLFHRCRIIVSLRLVIILVR